MKVDFFYNGKAYGSMMVKEAPRVGALYSGKMIIQVTDFRFSKVVSEGDSQVEQPDFMCELGDP